MSRHPDRLVQIRILPGFPPPQEQLKNSLSGKPDIVVREGDLDRHVNTVGPPGLADFSFVNGRGDLRVAWCPDAEETLPLPTCRSTPRIQGGLSLQYDFDRSHLKDWKAIDERLDQLVSSWIVK